MSDEQKARNAIGFQAVQDIADDLHDRPGLRRAWESLDVDVRAEIKSAWRKIVREALDRAAHADARQDGRHMGTGPYARGE